MSTSGTAVRINPRSRDESPTGERDSRKEPIVPKDVAPAVQACRRRGPQPEGFIPDPWRDGGQSNKAPSIDRRGARLPPRCSGEFLGVPLPMGFSGTCRQHDVSVVRVVVTRGGTHTPPSGAGLAAGDHRPPPERTVPVESRLLSDSFDFVQRHPAEPIDRYQKTPLHKQFGKNASSTGPFRRSPREDASPELLFCAYALGQHHEASSAANASCRKPSGGSAT